MHALKFLANKEGKKDRKKASLLSSFFSSSLNLGILMNTEECRCSRALLESSSLSSSSSSSADPVDAVIFVGVSLTLGAASKHLCGTRVPHTIVLLLLGVALGCLEYNTKIGLGKVGVGIRLWANINPDLLLYVFLPALIFEGSFAMDYHQIKRCMVQMLLLAGPGVLISTFCIGTAVKFTFPYNWDWKTSLLLGGLLSATDPVAVVALLKELGARKKLSTLIEGESMMNDGISIVVYQLFYQMVLGRSFGIGDLIKFLVQNSLGAVAVGLAFGVASLLWLRFIFNDKMIGIALTLAVSYCAYFTAQDGAGVSGILTVMTVAMFYTAVARTAFKGDNDQSLLHFWETVSYIANTLIFVLCGVIVAKGAFHSGVHFENSGTSWGYVLLLYFLVQVARMIVVGILYPFLQYFGYGLDWKEAVIVIWSGLRGAVALSLSLSHASDKSYSFHLNQEMGALFVFFTSGIVFLTIVVNGSTTQFILHSLSMDKLSATKMCILEYTRYEMLDKAMEALGDFGDDELGTPDWSTMKKYITCLSSLESRKLRPHNELETSNYQTKMTLSDMRVRLLNGVRAAYWGMIDSGRITQATSTLLIQSIDEAVDLIIDEPLCDWNILKAHVLDVVKTRQATYSVLSSLRKYLQNLEKSGLLEKKEMHQIDDDVQDDLKKLLKKPPLVKMPKLSEMRSVHPLLASLPSVIRESIESSTEKIMKMSEVTLYREGTKTNGIWLISSGTVEFSSKSLRHRHSLPPTFSHGSTLGLYEVLIGKPYICDIITNSVVHCFFIDSGKILSVLRSYLAVEEFFWKESATIIAKLVLPQTFEKMALQEIRVLMAERSLMKTYTKGDVIVIHQGVIGFILVGSVKTQDVREVLVTSPAALMPSQEYLGFHSLETPGADNYQVETRARHYVFLLLLAFPHPKCRVTIHVFHIL
ncbi:sodium/hydrogen exchanger 8 [Cinnamomum micranthum f. kanehirae]|uniref:Sodium/hydrogen exchanger 8 n=1 Tax=Cinnamomum micranthum f. kanehirae TaxID=337451 RepID=A0A443P2C7_9MAGN|nr:sodium/hydrogen exchanger 8 [Cinnamomum micranthum f. kanehirae]